MKLDTQNIIVETEKKRELMNRLEPYRQELQKTLENTGDYQGSQDSIRLPGDEGVVVRTRETVDFFAEVKLVVVIGIGGSNLGTKAVYEALGLPVRMEFIDTVDPLSINRVWAIMSMYQVDEVCVCVTTKSGGTAETLTNAEIIIARMRQLWGNQAIERVVVTSDQDSDLSQVAQEQGIKTLAHERVGGRYSVFSAVGIFPLSVAGCDVDQLQSGARAIVDQLQSRAEEELAVQSAISLYGLYQQKRDIHNLFVFNPELESVGKWYRQLMGESIGKKNDSSGQEVHAGITPTVAVGSTDLHSMAQLYLADPGDMTTTFVYVPREGLAIPQERIFPGTGSDLEGKDTQQVMNAIYDGTVGAYRNNHIPYMEIKMYSVNAFEIGQLLQMKMVEMMYLAYLMNLNAFDQPRVEDYKQVTRALLKRR